MNNRNCWNIYILFFLSGFSFTNIHLSQDCRGRGRAFPHYHFHPLHQHLDIPQVITAENLNWESLVSKCKSLTTKLRALNPFFVHLWF